MFGLQKGTCVRPGAIDADAAQIPRTDLGCHQLAHRHHTGARAISGFTDQRDTLQQPLQCRKVLFECHRQSNVEFVGEQPMALLNCEQFRRVLIHECCREHFVESIGDARNGRVHDQYAIALSHAFAGNRSDVSPARLGRDARTAELEYDPARVDQGGHGCRQVSSS